MSASVDLLLFAVVVATAAPRALGRLTLPDRSPLLGVVLWQSVSVSPIAAAVLAGALLAVPEVRFTTDLAELVSACSAAFRDQYSTPRGAATGAFGAALTGGVVARVGWCLIAELAHARRGRGGQLRALRLVADVHERSGALVVHHDVPAVYCLPGRGRHIVLTTAALARLDEAQLTAVLAHERAHLRHRHHLVLAVAAALHRALPGIPVYRAARAELGRLVEMHADDVAARGSARTAVATALVRLAQSATPVGALGAAGTETSARAQRMLVPARPVGLTRVLGTGLTALALFVGPGVIAAVPAIAVATTELCPLPAPSSR